MNDIYHSWLIEIINLNGAYDRHGMLKIGWIERQLKDRAEALYYDTVYFPGMERMSRKVIVWGLLSPEHFDLSEVGYAFTVKRLQPVTDEAVDFFTERQASNSWRGAGYFSFMWQRFLGGFPTEDEIRAYAPVAGEFVPDKVNQDGSVQRSMFHVGSA